MAFFNKKEEVIDIELTAYGKYLLSKGKFVPTFYAFSDDEIIYDPAYNASGSVEVGEQTFKRIVEEGISTKALYDGESAEARVYQLNGHVIRTDKQSGKAIRSGKINQLPLDDIYGKDYVDDTSMQPSNRGLVRGILTTGKLGDKYIPALSIKSLNNYADFAQPIELSSSGDTAINSALKVPQLNLNIDYRTFEYDYEDDSPIEVLELQTEFDKDIIFQDNKRLLIDDRTVILDFEEHNVDTNIQSGFDVEMFLIEEKEEEVKDASGALIRVTREITKKLSLGSGATQFDDNQMDIATFVDARTDTGIPSAELNNAGNTSKDILRVPTAIQDRARTMPTPNSPRSRDRMIDIIYNNFNPIDEDDSEDCD